MLRKKIIKRYYDQNTENKIRDFIHGNLRVERAWEKMLQWAPKSPKRILEIGCGVGYICAKMKKKWPDAKVVGLDISSESIKKAQELFAFTDIDFIETDIPFTDLDGNFDLIILMDVYEHIELCERKSLHAFLNRYLSPTGRIFLSFPTPEYQKYLKNHHPKEIQPVDEDVTLNDIVLIAQDTSAKILYYKKITVWQKNDYAHAILARNSDFYKPKKNNGDYCLAIFTPFLGALSESFITQHIKRLSIERTVVVTGKIVEGHWFEGPVKIIPFTSGPAKFSSKTENKVIQFLEHNKVTHILCEYGCLGTEIVELNERLLQLPLFVHFHGFDASQELQKKEVINYYKWMGRHVTGIIVVSKKQKERLIKIGLPEKKIYIIPCGVRIPGKKANPELSPCRFLSVIRLYPKKGPIYLLEAFLEAKKIAPEISLDIVGDGPLKQDVQKFISDHNLEPSVVMHGAQSNDYVLDLMRKSSAYVQHSVTDPQTGDAEGLPVAVLEASAAALPVISTYHEGIPDAVDHKITGFLVKEFDVGSMAKYMVKLASDGNLRKKMGIAAREKIKKEFKIDLEISKLRNLIGLDDISEKKNYNETAESNRNIAENNDAKKIELAKIADLLGYRVEKKCGGYIDCVKTVNAAKDNDQSITDYVETIWNQKGATQNVISEMQNAGCLNKLERVLEIGPGTGRYLEKVISKSNPENYIIYETANDWAHWLEKTYNVTKRNADGKTLKYETNQSFDLIHAHGVFVYLKFLNCFNYFQEMIRVCRPGGYIVFDFFSDSFLDVSTIKKWMSKDENYPVVLPDQTVKEFFVRHGAKLIAEFQNKYGQGYSHYHIYKLHEPIVEMLKGISDVSVVIPTYNRQKFIPRAINSILLQNRPVDEIIVVDDGSTDDTYQIIQSYQAQYPTVKYIRLNQNGGAQKARNVGIRSAKSEWISFLDSDDEWLPHRTEKAMEKASFGKVSAIYCDSIRQLLNGERHTMGTSESAHEGYIYNEILKKPFTTFPGLFVRKSCFEKIHFLDEFIISWQEWDTSIRLAKYYEFGFINEPLFIWHWHNDETISKDVYRDAQGYYQIVEKHRDEIINHLGYESLLKHYITIANKFIEVKASHELSDVKTKMKDCMSKIENRIN